jgi:hypothetical protein
MTNVSDSGATVRRGRISQIGGFRLNRTLSLGYDC